MNGTTGDPPGTSHDWRSWKVSVATGSGVVSRHGSTVLVALPAGDQQERVLDELLDLCAEATDAAADAAPSALVRRLVALVSRSDAGAVPDLGLVTSGPGGLVALLVGDVQLEVTTSDGSVQRLDGRDAAVVLDRRLPPSFARMRLTGASGTDPDPRSNLSGGVVSGSGVLVVPGRLTAGVGAAEETLVDLASPPERVADGVPTSASPPEAEPADPRSGPEPSVAAEAAQPVPTFTPISLTEPADEAADGEAAAAAEPHPDHVSPMMPVAVQVQGVMCSRQHFNDPRARFCSHCGISMVHQTHNLVTGVRPPLGVLVLDDGSVFSLVTDYVVGREPDAAEDVVAGRATPLTLEDPDLVMSRVHVRFLLDGWEVRVEDASSANGTFVAESETAEFTRVPPGVPTTITPGTRIALGGRTIVFESYRTG